MFISLYLTLILSDLDLDCQVDLDPVILKLKFDLDCFSEQTEIIIYPQTPIVIILVINF